MSGCGNCCGSCGSCSEMVLAPGELMLLGKLAQIPFLPVARKADDPSPVYLEDQDCAKEEYTNILLCLEKRGLITLDFDKPLKGFDSSAYAGYPIVGSFALTAKGQELVLILERSGLADA